MAALIVLFLLLIGSHGANANDVSMTEPEVKARFLLHFTKYVDWPATAFTATNAPLTIWVLGESDVAKHLEKRAQETSNHGRKIAVKQVAKDDDWTQCHILFVGASEKRRLGEILEKTRILPVLTVGESEQFTEAGGIIRFMKKNDTVRLEIDLRAAREARLQISSKLLTVADSVKGKQ